MNLTKEHIENLIEELKDCGSFYAASVISFLYKEFEANQKSNPFTEEVILAAKEKMEKRNGV